MKIKEKDNSPRKSRSKSLTKKYVSHNSATDSGTDNKDGHLIETESAESVATVEHHEESPNTSENESNCEKQAGEPNSSGIFRNDFNKEIPVTVRSIFNEEDITSDDEVFTFQCPETFRKQELCNKYLDFNCKTLVTNSGTFEMVLLSPEKKYITLAVPKTGSGGSLCKLPLKGHIILHKNIDITSNEAEDEDEDEDDNSTNAVTFPNDLKVRHPLLGIDWKAHVQEADVVINQNSNVKKKSKKIKKEQTSDFDTVECKTLKREHSEVEIVSHKQKRKKNS